MNTESELEKAVAALNRKGAVLLVPTETVYGLVCNWSDSTARDRIYAMKHRAENKPLAAFLPDVSFAQTLCGCPLPENAEKMARAFLPGPITLVVPDASGSTFGFRIPDHPFILALLKKFGGPLASTSANRSGQPPALEVGYALKTLAEQPDVVIDGGALPQNSIASTVVLVNADNSYKILREGRITPSMIERALKLN